VVERADHLTTEAWATRRHVVAFASVPGHLHRGVAAGDGRLHHHAAGAGSQPTGGGEPEDSAVRCAMTTHAGNSMTAAFRWRNPAATV